MSLDDVGLRVERLLDPDGAVVLRLDGELDLRSAPHLRAVIVEVFSDTRGTAPTLVIDLAALTYADSAGLSMLVATHKRARADGGTFRLRAPRSDLRRLLEVSALDQLFEIEDAAATSTGRGGDGSD
jgi:anti-anti-sigma factor